uniref:Uncharacterized protein n=1 Tax=Timema bartmani TaxID=61472 RepID=A0A7R9F441_9NEOP|nr:unnamed protein product [Timema bartmani]
MAGSEARTLAQLNGVSAAECFSGIEVQSYRVSRGPYRVNMGRLGDVVVVSSQETDLLKAVEVVKQRIEGGYDLSRVWLGITVNRADRWRPSSGSYLGCAEAVKQGMCSVTTILEDQVSFEVDDSLQLPACPPSQAHKLAGLVLHNQPSTSTG